MLRVDGGGIQGRGICFAPSAGPHLARAAAAAAEEEWVVFKSVKRSRVVYGRYVFTVAGVVIIVRELSLCKIGAQVAFQILLDD